MTLMNSLNSGKDMLSHSYAASLRKESAGYVLELYLHVGYMPSESLETTANITIELKDKVGNRRTLGPELVNSPNNLNKKESVMFEIPITAEEAQGEITVYQKTTDEIYSTIKFGVPNYIALDIGAHFGLLLQEITK